jgi:tetratricopeptide (TPR) repeat protein
MGIPQPQRANEPAGNRSAGWTGELLDTPYPGLRPFRQSDHDRFFGRTEDADRMAQQWMANRVTIVSGPVASGKTSLLQAGVYPLMAGRRWDVLPPGRVSHDATFPFAAVPDYNSYTFALLRSWLPDEVATRLAGMTVSDFVHERAQRHSGLIYAAIDQADDLLIDSESGPRGNWRRQFLDDLRQAVRNEPSLRLLLVTRGDARELIVSAGGNGARCSVAALTVDAAVEAVTGPTARVGRTFADGAAAKLVADVQAGEELVEPVLLQLACTRLWLDLPAEMTVITPQHVRAFGDADTAMAAHCGVLIAAVADEHDMTAGRLRSWLCTTFITEQDTRAILYEDDDAATDMGPVIHALVDRHLLTSGRRSGVRWYQLLSNRLIGPLREARDEPPPLPEPASSLRAAERALALGELDVAHGYAERTLRAGHDFRERARARSLLGNVAYERDQPVTAEAHYREAGILFEAASDPGGSALELAASGQMLLAQGRTAEAVERLRAAVDRVPNDLVIQTELALALWRLGEGRAGVAVLTGILAVDGGNAGALRARGEILADLGDVREAILDLDRQRAKAQPTTLAARGLALAGLGNHRAAITDINAALASAPHSGVVLLFAARAFAMGGNDTLSGDLARRAVSAGDPPLSAPQRKIALRLAAS